MTSMPWSRTSPSRWRSRCANLHSSHDVSSVALRGPGDTIDTEYPRRSRAAAKWRATCYLPPGPAWLSMATPTARRYLIHSAIRRGCALLTHGAKQPIVFVDVDARGGGGADPQGHAQHP